MKQFLGFLFLAIIFVVVLIATPYVGYLALLKWEQRSQYLIKPIEVDLPKGASLRSFSTDLQEQGLIDSAVLFHLWVRIREDYKQFKAGHYRFEDQVTPVELAAAFVEGKVYEPVVAQVTIPEGWSYAQITDLAVNVQIGSKAQFQQYFKDPVLLNELGIKSDSLEGYLYPATYAFTEIPSAREFIVHCVETFWNKLPKDYEARVEKKGLTLHQAVTFASLIELETPHDDERSAVAEVIWNRLNKKVALGIDAAIIYGIENYAGNITRSHLKDKANVYNTRMHRGLPPGPICSPSRKSLIALLRPTSAGYFYYVLDPSRGNRHHFSKSLKEHNKYVRKLIAYQKNLNK